jgi:hypothetical protein
MNGWLGCEDGIAHAAEGVFDKMRSLAILSSKAGEICCTLAALYVANESIWLQLRRGDSGEVDQHSVLIPINVPG